MNNNQIGSETYYAITSDYSRKPGMLWVKDDTKGFNEFRLYNGQRIDDWPEGIVFYYKGEVAEDYWLAGLQWNLVSDRVRQVITKFKVQGVQFLPLAVINYHTNIKHEKYWALNVYQEIESLKWKHIRGLDIFRSRNKNGQGLATIYISSRLKQYLKEGKALSGFGFLEIPERTLERD